MGYSTQSMTGGKFNMGGIVFGNVDGSDINLNDMTFANLTSSDDDTQADRIQVWDPATSGYTTSFNDNGEGDEENWGWWDATFEVDPILACGTAFWCKAKAGSGKKITFKKPYQLSLRAVHGVPCLKPQPPPAPSGVEGE